MRESSLVINVKKLKNWSTNKMKILLNPISSLIKKSNMSLFIKLLTKLKTIIKYIIMA